MKRVRYRALAAAWTIAAAAVLMSCGGEETDPATTENPWADAGRPESKPAETAATNIGDVEQQVRIDAVLSPAVAIENVEETVLEDAKKVINYVGLEIAPPYPDSLPIVVQLRSFRNFETAPVVIRARYQIDAEFGDGREAERIEQPLFDAVYGRDAHGKIVDETIDVMAPFEGQPESILLQVTAEALLMPVGTDAATIDPATAETTPDRSSTIKSNPVRIDFVGSEDAS